MDWAGKSIVLVFCPFSQNFTVLFSSELAKASSPEAIHLAILERLMTCVLNGYEATLIIENKTSVRITGGREVGLSFLAPSKSPFLILHI